VSDTPTPDTGTTHDQDAILTALKTVKDPEVGVNIVDLGLVYTVASSPGTIDVEMTLTSPACPAGPQIVKDAMNALEAMPGVTKANVKLVLTPPWTPERMTDDARDELGMF
jgi:metal-sulfur cluster biosynthetic enzyme